LGSALAARRGEFAAALHADFAKPATEVEITEVQPVLREIRYVRRRLRHWARPERVPTPALLIGTQSEIRREPKGVVLVLAPWNYPVYLALMPVVAALAAGNRVVLKPSERVPHTSAALVRLAESSIDATDLSVVQGDAEFASRLLDLPFDHIFFTGSARTARKILARAADRLIPVTLELGGKSPAILDPTASVTDAAERIVWGKFLNAGQTCVAPDYVWVPESVLPAFLEAARTTLVRFYGTDDAAHAGCADYCGLVDEAAQQRLVQLLDDAVRRGARIETGGATRNGRLAPTILSRVPHDAGLTREEIFGPILPVLAYRDLDDVLRSISAQGKPLALYLFSEDRHWIERVLSGTQSGGVVVNNVVVHLGNPYLPFGGIGDSGMGQYHGRFGFDTFSHHRAVLRQGSPYLLRLFHPPYGRRTERVLRFVDRLLS